MLDVRSSPLIGDVEADPNPLTFWWYATGPDYQPRVRAALECALGRWRAAAGLDLDVSFNAHHWVRFAPLDGASGTTGGSWSSARIKLDTDMSERLDCPVLVHEICHLLRQDNGHVGEACMKPTYIDSHITAEDLNAVCSKRACTAFVPEE